MKTPARAMWRLHLAAVCALGSMCVVAVVDLRPRATVPDILLVVLDDVAAADLALYGGPVATPNLTALAGGGVLFTRAYANPTCAPTRRAMLTGHWWVTGNGPGCPGESADTNTPQGSEVFLPEALPHASGICGKWHLGADPAGGPTERAPIVQGFDFWLAGSPGNVDGCGGTGYSSWLRIDAEQGWHSSSISTGYEPTAVRQAWTAGWATATSPKLAVVSINLAHSPFHAPPPSLLPVNYVVGPGNLGKYEAMIVAYDTLLGQILAQVDLETTLVVVVGDNGTPPSVAPDRDKAKGTPFERGCRVPLVIAGGPTVGERVSDELVHAVDIWATLIEAGGGTAPGGSPFPIVSSSLMPILLDQPHAAPHEYVLVGSRWGDTDGDIASIRLDGTKLRQRDLDGDLTVDVTELYDLSTDPDEVVNQAANPAFADTVAAHLAWTAQALP